MNSREGHPNLAADPDRPTMLDRKHPRLGRCPDRVLLLDGPSLAAPPDAPTPPFKIGTRGFSRFGVQ